MKVLWVVNTVFPDFAKSLDLHTPLFGGWMYGLATAIADSDTELHVATVIKGAVEKRASINGISYYLLDGKTAITGYDKNLEQKWKSLVSMIDPDIVHIHGTEYAHGLALVNSCAEIKTLISIQGMVSVVARYYYAGITHRDIFKNITIRDILKYDTLFNIQHKFKSRGKLIEHKYLNRVQHFIGRTNWDHSHIKSINPEATYHFCNESLRAPFYTAVPWSLDKVQRHSIFLSQAGYPIKGLHMALKAGSILKNYYPDLRFRVAGYDITSTKTTRDYLRLSGYGKYLKRLIRKLGLEKNIVFTGPLDAEAMIGEYTRSHVFVCPSSIENSPNSVGEAQLLGVPCIASYVGGVPDMIEDQQTGLLYRFEEYEMLAAALMKVFNDDALARQLSANGQEVARMRHNRELNTTRTLEIYRNILREG